MAKPAKRDRRLREKRFGFRVDAPTKALIERAALLERRKLTDFCMTALADAARRAIAEHETIVLSERDRAVFFDTLVNLPAPSERLKGRLRSKSAGSCGEEGGNSESLRSPKAPHPRPLPAANAGGGEPAACDASRAYHSERF